MKIKIIGCYVTWVKELSTSFLIDDQILFDVPQGSFKTISTENDLSKINYIIISHFHSDHFADLHLIIDVISRQTPKRRITIIAPKGCRERLIELFKILEVSHLEVYLNEDVTFIECENNKIIKIGDYKIKCYKMLHQNLDAYGFTIENNGSKIGFTGDSAMCNNVRKIIKSTKATFIDSSNIIQNNKHLNAEEVITLSKEFPSCKLIPVHMTYQTREILKNTLEIPNQGKEFIF